MATQGLNSQIIEMGDGNGSMKHKEDPNDPGPGYITGKILFKEMKHYAMLSTMPVPVT